ncbi:hypothetical protein Q8A73_002812 [Channa argus]|nr:hypothetical protein Q8A73_002812 [Channa argus]
MVGNTDKEAVVVPPLSLLSSCSSGSSVVEEHDRSGSELGDVELGGGTGEVKRMRALHSGGLLIICRDSSQQGRALRLNTTDGERVHVLVIDDEKTVVSVISGKATLICDQIKEKLIGAKAAELCALVEQLNRSRASNVPFQFPESPALYRVSNAATFGLSEVVLTQQLVDGAKLLIAMEKRLEANGDIDELVPTQK